MLFGRDDIFSLYILTFETASIHSWKGDITSSRWRETGVSLLQD
jgi:hypothetical protein